MEVSMGRVSPAMREIGRLEPEDAERVLTDPQFWTTRCFAAFLRRCADLVRESPSIGLKLAKLAPAYSQRLRLSAGKKRDAKIRAFAELGAAFRAQGNLGEATTYFEDGERLGGTPLARGHLYARWADLLIEKRDTRAIAMANEAISLFTVTAPGTEIHAASLIVRGVAYRILTGDILRSQSDYVHALSMLSPKKHERVYCAAIHNLGCAILLGSTQLAPILGALKLAEKGLRQQRVRKSSIPHAKVRWLRALAFEKFGSTQLATDLFQRARNDLLALGAYKDFVQVSLDLSRLYYIAGQVHRIRRIVGELAELPLSLEQRAVILLWQEKATDTSFDAETLIWLYRKIYGISFPVLVPREPSGL